MNSSNFPFGHFKVDWFLFLSICAAHRFVSRKSSAFCHQKFSRMLLFTQHSLEWAWFKSLRILRMVHKTFSPSFMRKAYALGICEQFNNLQDLGQTSHALTHLSTIWASPVGILLLCQLVYVISLWKLCE